MAVLDHWHPVFQSRRLKKRPVAITLAGQKITLFRSGPGQVGALDDTCPHRRMSLARGKVCAGKLQCCYHGWTFNADGSGESPGTPKMHATANSYATAEAHGLVWIRSRDSQRSLPEFDSTGFVDMGLLEHRVRAPLELVLDNFTEMEHTPTTHAIFGYPLERMQEVTVQYEPTETAVKVRNAGPSKTFPFLQRQLMGLRKHYHFHDDFTTHFSPVHNIVEQYWDDPRTGKESRLRLRLVIFFTPVTDHETIIYTLAYGRSSIPYLGGGIRLFRWLIRKTLDHEIRLDARILENLATQDVSIEGLKLSRFDRVLGLNRERLARVYRGVG